MVQVFNLAQIATFSFTDSVGQVHHLGQGHLGGPPVWRLTLWYEGRAYLTSVMQPEPPTLSAMMEAHRLFPLEWSELVRGKGNPS